MQPDTPPSTPSTPAKSTYSSQTSSGKSRYPRKFNAKWLASSPSTSAGSPTSGVSPAPDLSPRVPSPSSTSTQQEPFSTFPESAIYADVNVDVPDRPAPPPRYHMQPGRQLPSYEQVYDPRLPSYEPLMVYGRPVWNPSGTYTQPDSRPLDSTSSTSPGSAMDYSPSVFRGQSSSTRSNTSPGYGGEAHHVVPLGIRLSPGNGLLPGQSSHASAPLEPLILEVEGSSEDDAAAESAADNVNGPPRMPDRRRRR